jgi:hypothetical protein
MSDIKDGESDENGSENDAENDKEGSNDVEREDEILEVLSDSQTSYEHEIKNVWMKERKYVRSWKDKRMYLYFRQVLENGDVVKGRHQYWECQTKDGLLKCCRSFRTRVKRDVHRCDYKKEKEKKKTKTEEESTRNAKGDDGKGEKKRLSEKEFLKNVVCLICGCGLPVGICNKKVFKNFLYRLLEMQGKASSTLLGYIKHMNEEKVKKCCMNLVTENLIENVNPLKRKMLLVARQIRYLLIKIAYLHLCCNVLIIVIMDCAATSGTSDTITTTTLFCSLCHRH